MIDFIHAQTIDLLDLLTHNLVICMPLRPLSAVTRASSAPEIKRWSLAWTTGGMF